MEMGKRIKLFWEANNFPFVTSLNYLRFASMAEKIFDFLIPAILTGLILLMVAIIEPSTSTVLKGIKDINNQSLTFISILAGFNIASVSVLATAGSSLLKKLKDTESKTLKGKTLYEIMMTFFCAAVVSQFLIILIGVIILVLSSLVNLPANFNISYLWLLIAIWVYSLLLTIFISLRNLKILFFIMVNEEY
jgi:hypothetical protein